MQHLFLLKKILSSFLIGFFVVYLLTYFYIASSVYKDTATPADTIIVLGAKSYINASYNPCLVARVDQAVSIAKEDFAKTIIFSGGNDLIEGDNQAATMQKIAQEKQSPARHLLEKESRTTYENLLFSKEVMKKNNLRSAIIVSDPYHTPRAALIAEKLDIDATVSPSTQSPCWTQHTYLSWYIFRESLAIMYYAITGRI